MEDDVRYVERKVAGASCDDDADSFDRQAEKLVLKLFSSEAAEAASNENDNEPERDHTLATSTTRKKVGYSSLVTRIQSVLQRSEVQSAGKQNVSCQLGRIGVQTVAVDMNTLVGNMHMESDRLTLVGVSDFATIRANCAVYSGKWMYEAMLSTRGVMQFGWCTLDCQFSEEKGVGDTSQSYAYDGHRLRKWNMTTEKYGEPWFAGDVIGCAIDLDSSCISFYRNGRPLGDAFMKLPIGPNIAYFPAFSLSANEAVRLNFGALPFLHPVPGYQPLQAAPLSDDASAAKLTSFLERVLLQLLACNSPNPVLSQIASAASNKEADSGSDGMKDLTSQDVVAAAHLNAVAGSRGILYLSAYHVLQRLTPYLTKAYHVQSCLVGMLVRLHNLCMASSSAAGSSLPSGSSTVVQPSMQAFIDLTSYLLDLLYTFLHENEVAQCLEQLMVALLTLYRFSPVPIDFSTQKQYLQIVYAVLSHSNARRFLLSHVLFDRMRFPLFLHVKPPDDNVLEQLIPQTWLVFPHKFEDVNDARFNRSDGRKTAFFNSCAALRQRIAEIQTLQTELLKLLLRDDDDDSSECAADVGRGSRAIFIRKLRGFMKENYASNSRLAHTTASPCPIQVLLCFLHHLIRAVGFYYQRLVEQVNAAVPPDVQGSQSPRGCLLPAFSEVYIPMNKFYDGMLGHLDVQRLGGLASFLRKSCKSEMDAFEKQRGSLGTTINNLQAAVSDSHLLSKRRTVDSTQLSKSSQQQQKMSTARSLFSSIFPFVGGSSSAMAVDSAAASTSSGIGTASVSPAASTNARHGNQTGYDFDAAHSSLLQLIDSCVLLYHIGAHKQNGKMSTLRESMRDYYLALHDLELKLERCSGDDVELRSSLEHTRSIFEAKLTEDSRHMAWILAVVFVEQNRAELYWLMRVLLSTVKHARRTGVLFSFVPDYYIDTLVSVYQALCFYFHPTLDLSTLDNFDATLVDFAKFLAKNANDKRIVSHDVKEKLQLALCTFSCYRFSMQALEKLSSNSSEALLQLVLQVYENRTWTETNMILIRFWKGSGWAFRYLHLPHIIPLRSQQSELIRASMEPACPSPIYQDRIKRFLLKDYDRATALINSVLNELNWSFSEFICFINDIHKLMSSAERVALLNRQLKLRATLFDLSVSLLRVVEMFVHLVPEYFLDSHQCPRAEMLLSRLYQIIAQILHRVTCKGNVIIEVLQFNLNELESIDRFPILAAIVGVLCQLIFNHGNPKWREQALRGLINDAGIDLASLQYLLGIDNQPSEPFDEPDQRGMMTSAAIDDTVCSSINASRIRTGAMPFSFHNYKEVSRNELKQLHSLVQLVSAEYENPIYKKVACNEDQLCTICYANARDATFKPCEHQSCKSCISQQMLIKKECFFCKGVVQAVHDSVTGEQLSFK